MIYHFIIIFIFYSLYVQLSPTMGNIWLRPDSDGTLVFCPLGLVDLILAPLQSDKLYFWESHFWPINFFIYIIVYFFIYLLVVKGYNHTLFLNLNEKVHEHLLQ
jgi:hypothetical protein